MLAACIRKNVRAAACAVLVAIPAWANINLEWRPLSQTVEVGDLIEIEIWAVSDSSADQMFSALDVIISWDPNYLEFLGHTGCTGCPDWLLAGFLNDPYGINEAFPPQDGDGIFTALAPIGAPIAATPTGTPITVLQFTSLAMTGDNSVGFLESAGSPTGYTTIYDGAVPGLIVTGELGAPTHAEILCQMCPGDLNGDGTVGIADLAELLGHYGVASGALPSEGDLDCDGDVQLDDLAALLGVYGTTCD